MTTTMHRLETAEADIAYDVHGPLPTADGRPPLFMIGQPMDASGFGTLASYFPDRTVITYDPRGLGRSTRKDGRVDNTPACHGRGRRRGSATRGRASRRGSPVSAFHRPEDGRDLADDGFDVLDRADGLMPGPPEHPRPVVGPLAADSFVQRRSVGVGYLEVRFGCRDDLGRKFPLL
jgi:hypothetical protein